MINKKIQIASPIFVTNICPVECDHCAYSSTKEGFWTPLNIIDKFCYELCNNNFLEVTFIDVTGGEPLNNLIELERRLNIIIKYFDPSKIIITTSGFWAINENSTKKILEFLYKKSIKRLHVSTDRFHLKKVSLKNTENILLFSKDYEIKVTLKPLLDTKSEFLTEPLMNLILKYNPNVVFCVLDPLGRAQKLDKSLMKSVEISEKFMKELERRKNKLKLEV